MRISYSGTDGIMFPTRSAPTNPNNTQSSVGVTASGWNATAKPVRLNGLKVETGASGTFGNASTARHIQQWDGYWVQSQNTTVNLLYNTGSYEDVNFTFTLVAFHSSISYQMWTGTFGGYGQSWTGYGSGACTLGTSSVTAGLSYLRTSFGALTGGTATCYAQMTIYGDAPIQPIIGGLY